MRRKYKIIVSSYIAAGLAVLGIGIWRGSTQLSAYRLAAQYSAGRAFGETVGAVEGLSTALEKSIYASDRGMCAKICAQIYARALAAETAMSALPFSTQELEQISGFLNLTGDYAYTLSLQAAESGFTEEQIETLGQMSERASEFSDCLRQLQSDVNSGIVIMDSRERDRRNVGMDKEPEKLSSGLLGYEEKFRPVDEPVYDGQYGKNPGNSAGAELSMEEILKMAAEYTGRDSSSFKKEYDYAGTDGRSCYSSGDIMLCLSPDGVDSFSGSRLVKEIRIDRDEALRRAEEFLKKQGYKGFELTDSRMYGALCAMRFAGTEAGALCRDNCLSLSVAMDDGSIYSFNRMGYSPGETDVQWNVDEKTAAEKIPAGLACAGSRRVIRKSPGGRNVPCWEFSCVSKRGEGVKIYVEAEKGRQYDIVMEDSPV